MSISTPLLFLVFARYLFFKLFEYKSNSSDSSADLCLSCCIALAASILHALATSTSLSALLIAFLSRSSISFSCD